MKNKRVLSTLQTCSLMLTIIIGAGSGVRAEDLGLELNERYLSYSPDESLVAVQTPIEQLPNRVIEGKVYRSGRQRNDAATTIVRNSNLSFVATISPPIIPCWSPDNKFIAGDAVDISMKQEGSFISENCIDIYDANSGVRKARIDANYILSKAWSSDSKRLLISANESIFVYDLESAKVKVVSPSTKSAIWRRVTWSPDDKLISAILERPASGYRSARSLAIWNVKVPAKPRQIVVSETSSIGDKFWTTDSTRLVFSEAGIIHVVDLKTMKDVSFIRTDDAEAVQFAITANQKLVACKDDDSLLVLNGDNMTIKWKVRGDDKGQFKLTWSPKGRLLLVQSKDLVSIFDAETGKYIAHRSFKDLVNASWIDGGNKINLYTNGTLDPGIFIKMIKTHDGNYICSNATPGGANWATAFKPRYVSECIKRLDDALAPEMRSTFKSARESEISSYIGDLSCKPMLLVEFGKWNLTYLRIYFRSFGIARKEEVEEIIATSYRKIGFKAPSL